MNRFLLAILLSWLARPALSQTVTELVRNGANGDKRNLVIIGDGFTANDQAAYNTFVDNFVMKGLFTHDAYDEMFDAFNVYRINVNSAQSGVTRINDKDSVLIARNTALDYRYSGIWNKCWMQGGPQTETRLIQLLNQLVPQYDYVFIILNETGFGGCAGGNRLAVTRGANDASPDWSVAAHEMGHMVNGLGDEYSDCGGLSYNGGEPGAVNLTTVKNRNTIKWKEFIAPSINVPTSGSACPTGLPAGLDGSQSAGCFEGAVSNLTKFQKNLFKPAFNCRMTSNSPEFCPICYNHMQTVLKPYRSYNFNKPYAGDFTGDGQGDLLLHFGNSIALYRSTGAVLEHTFTGTERINVGGSSWQFTEGDRFFVADFNGDGKKDLFVFNASNWGGAGPYFALLKSTGSGFECIRRYDKLLEGWQMSAGDQFHVGDFDGDGKDDFYITNTTTWTTKYAGLMRSTGTAISFVRRYDNTFGAPSAWTMGVNDKHYVGDFDGDGKDDLYITNLTNWTTNYVGMLRSEGGNVNLVRVFANTLPGWTMADNDQHFVGDFDGDKKDDLYVFNGTDWNPNYLLMVRSTGSDLAYVKRFDGSIPGWGTLARHDQFYTADINGDGKKDLFVFNRSGDYATEFLGRCISSGTTLSTTMQGDWIGNWNLGKVDNLLVTNFNGGSKWDDLFIYNTGWFGMLQSTASNLTQVFIAPTYIHNFRYHQAGWW